MYELCIISILYECTFILHMSAKVSSRPGQEGKVDGYLLEGEELDAYLDQIKDIISVSNS